MNINIGSTNQVKITAISEIIKLYPRIFPNPEILGIEIDVAEFGHPINVDDTVAGAISRAKKAFENCTFSFGIEGGLIAIPETESGYMETTVCAIYDGKQIYLGLGPAFEWPLSVTQKILNGEADASLAFKQLGLTNDKKLGAVKGGINAYLTNNRLTREDAIKASVILAMIRIEKREMYKSQY